MNKVNRDTENNFPRNARNVQNVQCQCSYHCSDITGMISSVRNVPKGVERNLTIKVNNAQLMCPKNKFPRTRKSNLQLNISLLESTLRIVLEMFTQNDTFNASVSCRIVRNCPN